METLTQSTKSLKNKNATKLSLKLMKNTLVAGAMTKAQRMELVKYKIEIGYIPSDEPIEMVSDEPVDQPISLNVPLCPKCLGSNFIKEGGCEICKDCGGSACG